MCVNKYTTVGSLSFFSYLSKAQYSNALHNL